MFKCYGEGHENQPKTSDMLENLTIIKSKKNKREGGFKRGPLHH